MAAMEESGSSAATFRRWIGVLLRLLLVLLIGIGLGAGAYFGLPLVYRGLLEPSRENAEQIEILADELERTRADLSELAESGAARSAELEAEGAALNETVSELQARAELDRAQLEQQLDRLGTQLDDLEQSLESQAERLAAAVESASEPNDQLLDELQVNRALLHLMRARLWLIENNAGLAAEQAQLAKSALDGVEGAEPAVARLDQALIELETTPLVASEDLEIAWILLTAEPAE